MSQWPVILFDQFYLLLQVAYSNSKMALFVPILCVWTQYVFIGSKIFPNVMKTEFIWSQNVKAQVASRNRR